MEKSVKIINSELEYAIALQQAIEYHCRGLVIPEYIAKKCPYHAKMLNKNLLPSESK